MLRNLEFRYNLPFYLAIYLFFHQYFLMSHYCASKVIWVAGGVTEGGKKEIAVGERKETKG